MANGEAARELNAGVTVDAPPVAPTHEDLAPFRNETVFLLALAILLFSTLDGIFTVLLIETGHVYEWNPVMAVLLDRDLRLFAAAKSIMTNGGVFLLVAFLHRRVLGRIPVRHILELVFGAYLLIMIYHLTLTFTVT
ncbi:MAG: DUF5658 family protein [Gemmatimonadota bacterium]